MDYYEGDVMIKKDCDLWYRVLKENGKSLDVESYFNPGKYEILSLSKEDLKKYKLIHRKNGETY